jgi:hypothetical protein
MKAHLKVEFELPEGATKADALAYVYDAVSSWKGSLKPPFHEAGGMCFGDETDPEGDPMFLLDGDTILVRHMRR